MKIYGNLAFSANKYSDMLDAVVTDGKTITHLRSGYYLKVFDIDDIVLWQGELINDTEAIIKQGRVLGFVPKGIDFYEWNMWLDAQLPAELTITSPKLEKAA